MLCCRMTEVQKMRRLRGPCKGCKCCVKKENGEYQCMALPYSKRLKKPPETCKKRCEQ